MDRARREVARTLRRPTNEAHDPPRRARGLSRHRGVWLQREERRQRVRTGARVDQRRRVDGDRAGFSFSTGPFEIQPGDTFECFYTDTITDRQLNVQTAIGQQGPGGHHLTVYYADQKAPVGHHPCNDVEMLGLHQIAGAAGGKEGIIALPDGYATKIPAGKQLVVQAHYVRTEPGPATV